jgi:tripartite-type tricarboxylate transporter receptor subunit TctC
MRLFVAIVLAVCAGLGSAHAQGYPSRPVTMIVPFPAGGVTDIVARLMSEYMRGPLGQPVIAENVAGAGGTIGVTRLYRSPADGYTFAIGQWTSHVGSGAMYSLPFDFLKDFEPIAMVSIGPLWIIGRKDFPANDIRELIAWLKANPGKASVATIGAGSGAHMCMIYFANETGTSMQFVPYRGAAPAMQDMIAGQIDLFCPEAGQTLPQFGAGAIKAYAVMGDKRWFKAPGVPTVAEAGVPGVVFPFWHALWAPKGTPRDIVGKLNAAAVDALANPAVRARLTDLGHEVAPRERQTPEGLAAYHKAELDKWWPIIKAANIKAE